LSSQFAVVFETMETYLIMHSKQQSMIIFRALFMISVLILHVWDNCCLLVVFNPLPQSGEGIIGMHFVCLSVRP